MTRTGQPHTKLAKSSIAGKILHKVPGVIRMRKTIIEILEDIPDYRRGNAIKHKLVDILRTFLELPHGMPSAEAKALRQRQCM